MATKNKKFYEYILLASIREYVEVNKLNIHKFTGYVLYILIAIFILKAGLFAGVKYYCLFNILLLILMLISYETTEFDNFISYCQNTNNKILLSYPANPKTILFVNNFKYLLFHMVIVNLVLLPIIINAFLDNQNLFFLIKFIILSNLLCVLSSMLGWIRWINKWKEIKLEKRNIFKSIFIIVISILAVFLCKSIIGKGFTMGNVIYLLKKLNSEMFNIYNKNYLWILLLVAIFTIYILQGFIKNRLEDIYKFYILNQKSTENLEIKDEKINIYRIINKFHFNIKLKKEFYAIFRNKNIYNEICRKLRFSIFIALLLAAYQWINPINVDFQIIEICLIMTITGYGDKIIRTFLPIASEEKMIINYIQSGINIKKILLNKVNMLFLYRQLFILAPLIVVLGTTRFNIFKVLHFLALWIIICYTSANIKIYSMSINTHYLTTDVSMNKMNIFDSLKYIAMESMYSYLIFIIVLVSEVISKGYIFGLFFILWLSVIFIISILLLQGDGKKFYGEFKKYI